MIWTTEKPGAPGWYWMRMHPNKPPRVYEVLCGRDVFLGAELEPDELYIHTGVTIERLIRGYEWGSEPLPEPDPSSSLDVKGRDK